ncbi:leucine-rich repeat and sterile alpha motif-containing 1 [Plakobranchus ocellatus]|uniref:Leucine-rich repeat and sterile alpha motif-containing 1 n=1 Tax=Plakobranchus ocellatus TaxID=259542 RepID=A0AAV4DZX3_9GAST|nr:leucine-rich repeat and sterile alpha motif-containing 1 [Plakobranchus ocellatus]
MSFFRRKKKDKNKDENSPSEKKRMPLFARQSEKGRKRQQDQELLAQQDPGPRFDLSGCEMIEVPEGVYAMCKILQKQILLLNDNDLSDLSGGGDLEDLEYLKVLDLHTNHLKTLPDSIGCLIRLEVLDLSSNRLKHLPDTIGNLKHLQTLKLRDNRLKAFPEHVCELPYLRTLDISHNAIRMLPSKLYQNRALETLILDAADMEYPSKEICQKSTENIMKFLCKEVGVEYEHPSKYWFKVGEGGANTAVDSEAKNKIASWEAQMNEGVQAYQEVLDRKRRDVEELQRTLYAEHTAQAELAAKAAENHRKLLSSIELSSEKDTMDLSELSKQKAAEKAEFLQYLQELESGAGNLVAQLLDYNAKAKETEELLEELEKARIKEDDSFKVRWEEFQNMRKQEILDNMQIMLAEFASMEEARLDSQLENDQQIRDAMEEEMLNVGQIESLIYYRDSEHRKMVTHLAQQEELQKAAFEALLVSQDATNQRIQQQIALIEAELAQITAAEMVQRAQRTEHDFTVVADQRIALSAMLSQLLEERDKRRVELRKRLVEMEQERENGQHDYWLVQYQRLLDWKPQSLIDKESQLEISVKEILVSSGAEEYIPKFARHRITIETMLTLTDDDLKQMGVHQVGLRKAILKNIDLQKWEAGDKAKSRDKESGLEVDVKKKVPQVPSHEVTPSAPPANVNSVASPLYDKQVSVTARGLNSECAICLDKESTIIFLTCGHVCCCAECARPLSECPLCRAPISAKVKLTLGTTAQAS